LFVLEYGEAATSAQAAACGPAVKLEAEEDWDGSDGDDERAASMALRNGCRHCRRGYWISRQLVVALRDTTELCLRTAQPRLSGLELLRVIIERLFVDNILTQHKGLQRVLQEIQANIMIGDDFFAASCRCSSGHA
jgi:hypothetical protein